MPFVLGGDDAVDDLSALPAADGMRIRGELATQLRDRPDGARVHSWVID